MPDDLPACTLRMVTYQELGQLGPAQNEAGSFEWHPARRFSTWSLAALLSLLLVVPRANRRLPALAIFVPLGLCALVGWGFDCIAIALEESSGATPLGFLALLCTGWALVCSLVLLAAPWLTGRSRTVTALKILAAVCVAALLQGVWYADDPLWMGGWLGCILLGATVTIVPCMLAGCQCRRWFGDEYFGIAAFLWLLGLLIGATFVIGGLAAGFAALDGLWASKTAGLLWGIVAAAVAVGMCVFFTTAPFALLTLANRFYGDRLETLFHLANAPIAPVLLTDAGSSPFAPQPQVMHGSA